MGILFIQKYLGSIHQSMLNDCPICGNIMRIKRWLYSLDGGEELFEKYFFNKSNYTSNHNIKSNTNQ